ncbi:hypothetical protein D3C84_984900 [compost metagenome]
MAEARLHEQSGQRADDDGGDELGEQLDRHEPVEPDERCEAEPSCQYGGDEIGYPAVEHQEETATCQRGRCNLQRRPISGGYLFHPLKQPARLLRRQLPSADSAGYIVNERHFIQIGGPL